MTEGQGASAGPVPLSGTGDAGVPVPDPPASHPGAVPGSPQAPAAATASPATGSPATASPITASPAVGSPATAGPAGASPAAGHARPDTGQYGGAHAGAAAREAGSPFATGLHGAARFASGGRQAAGRPGAASRAAGAHAAGAHAAGAAAGGPPLPGTWPGAHAGPDAAGPDAVPEAGRPAGPGSAVPGPASGGPGSPGGAGPAGGRPVPLSPAGGSPPAPASPAGHGPGDVVQPPTEPYVKVDARRLENALLALRHPIVTVPLLLEAPGVAEARAERRKLLSQIDDYLLPRLRQSGAPILVALVGSTGAGKSTLMNSLVGKQVSQTGIRRPTTNSPVLACHPGDAHWFAENVFLPTLPRVRQQGLAMPGRDGLLVLAASEGMPQGVALLDTPDIDSVVQAHRDFAHQFLDASDLWLFMTSARRYADAAVWELLQDARDRGAALAVVLSRVPPSAAPQLRAHFDAMLEANGLTGFQRFLIAETMVTNAMLPEEIARPVREWLTATAAGDDRRVAVLTQTMSGMLDTFRTRIPALASHASTQLTLRQELRETVRAAYDAGLDELIAAASDGSLVSGEVLARWQDFAGTGDLMRTLQVRRGRAGASKSKKKRRMPARAGALRAGLRASLESATAAIADRAAEDAVRRWQQHPAGAVLLSDLAAAAEAGRSAASDYLAMALADLGMADNARDEGGPEPVDAAALSKASPELAAAARKAIRGWQDNMLELVQAENVTKRSIARVVSFDTESLALVLMIGVLGTPRGAASGGEEAEAGPERLLSSLFGAGLLRDLTARARQDLRQRVAALFDVEQERFSEVIDAAGTPDETVAAQLVAASEALEAAR
ncbi:MAG TPA: GTPase [Streptosporangiaceae bacterium]|nr:GTPase [Streptosporangiaceae bacterium]